MIIDQNLILSGSANAAGAWTGQSLAASAGTFLSTNVIDKSPFAPGSNPPMPDWGIGEDLVCVFDITETVASGGAATVQFQLIESADPSMSSPQVVVETAAYALSDLGAGKQIVLRIPRATPRTPLRYLAARYTVGTATTTAGKVITALVHDYQDLSNRTFPSGFTVA